MLSRLIKMQLYATDWHCKIEECLYELQNVEAIQTSFISTWLQLQVKIDKTKQSSSAIFNSKNDEIFFKENWTSAMYTQSYGKLYH